MKAIVREKYGPPNNVLKLEDLDKPAPEDGEVLVRVHAAGAHIGDWLMIRGEPYIARPAYGLLKPKNSVPGIDVAGRVEAVDPNVEQFQPGDEVFGWCNGAFAEYAAVSEDALAPKPQNLTFEQAATVPTSAFAALQALRDAGQVQSEQKVLIIGASGAVGTYAVQIAKSFGAEVTGVCSTRNVEMVRSIGADHVIDYTKESITEGGQRHDLILNIAGNRPLFELRQALTSKGTIVMVGTSGGPWLMGFGRTIRALVINTFVSQQLRALFSTPTKEDLIVLKDLIEAGKVTPVIDRTFPLGKTSEAFRYIGERHTQGKIVITTGLEDGSQ